MIDSLTTVKKVNKTDAATLLNNFKVSTAFMAHPSCLHINLPDNGETSPSLQGRVDNVSRTGATKGDSSSNTLSIGSFRLLGQANFFTDF